MSTGHDSQQDADASQTRCRPYFGSRLRQLRRREALEYQVNRRGHPEPRPALSSHACARSIAEAGFEMTPSLYRRLEAGTWTPIRCRELLPAIKQALDLTDEEYRRLGQCFAYEMVWSSYETSWRGRGHELVRQLISPADL